MTKAEQIEQLQFEQDMDEFLDIDHDDDAEDERRVQLTGELDYYPEDEFDMDQRNAEFEMIDPLGDGSDI
jgi:hypothetical protein